MYIYIKREKVVQVQSAPTADGDRSEANFTRKQG